MGGRRFSAKELVRLWEPCPALHRISHGTVWIQWLRDPRFSDFWDSEFPVTQDYTIYPQTEKLRRLSISPEPDSFLRVWFLVEDGCNAKLKSPEIQTFEPVGFYATEWGVMFSGGLEGPKLWVTGL